MRKTGKNEKMRKKALLQTYITSLLCLVLCVTMFFGTTAAWFTDTTTNQGNQIYVGTLDVALNHATYHNGVRDAVAAVEAGKPVLDSNIKWEPGYTEVKMFEVVEGEKNDLAFSYQMSIDRTFAENGDEAEIAIAKAITVWNCDSATDMDTLSTTNFQDLVASGWTRVGTLYEVITQKTPVFSDKMDRGDVAGATAAKKIHMIALHMDENFDGAITKDENGAITASVQGDKLDGITIKMVATQLPSEEDSFGANYDRMPADIVVVKEVKKNADNTVAEPVVLAATSNSAVSVASVEVPAGAAVEADATALALSVKAADNKNTGTVVTAGKKVLPLEIKVEGLASNNNTVIPVKLTIDKGLTGVEVYHEGVAMTAADTKADGTFTYDAESGLLTLYVTSFSPFDIVYRDDGVVDVATSAELEAAVKNGAKKILLAEGKYTVDLYNITARDSLTITGQGAGTKLAFENLQVRLELFENLTIRNCTIERMATKSWGHLVFGSSAKAGGVYTISDCIFNGVGTQGIYINQNVAATFNIVNCTFDGNFGEEGAITIQNNKDVNITVNVDNCTFNNIPDTSHKICLLYTNEGVTLNAKNIKTYCKESGQYLD